MTKRRKLKDYNGLKIGFLTVGDRIDTGEGVFWEVICDCGGKSIFPHKDISGRKKSNCGCGIRKSKFLPGGRFGRLTIVGRPKIEKTKHRNIRFYPCKCDCGNEDVVHIRDYNLTSGNTTSCGCVGMESRIIHGMTGTPTYNTWEAMIRRCSPAHKDRFPRYAGRGITVCEKWKTFEGFFEDMGVRPEGHTLDRIDYDGNYNKGNCRWATESVQGYNKPLDPNNTSGKSGVSFYSGSQKWSAEIHVQGEHIRLGMFDSFNEAVQARENAEIKYYGWNKD